MKMSSFTSVLREIESKKDKYEIIIDHDYVRIQPKEEFEGGGLETYRFKTTPDDILWEILTEKVFTVRKAEENE